LNGLCEYRNSRERGRREEGEGPDALHFAAHVDDRTSTAGTQDSHVLAAATWERSHNNNGVKGAALLVDLATIVRVRRMLHGCWKNERIAVEALDEV
jgi:hypothetical protein